MRKLLRIKLPWLRIPRRSTNSTTVRQRVVLERSEEHHGQDGCEKGWCFEALLLWRRWRRCLAEEMHCNSRLTTKFVPRYKAEVAPAAANHAT